MGKIFFAVISVLVLIIIYILFKRVKRANLAGFSVARAVISLNQRQDLVSEFGTFDATKIVTEKLDFKAGKGIVHVDLIGTKKSKTITLILEKNSSGYWTYTIEGFD